MKYVTTFILCLLLVSGCKSKTLEMDTARVTHPENWTGLDSANKGAVKVNWLEDFKDPVLIALVSESLEHNHNLQAAANRMHGARAQAAIQGASLYPEDSIGFSGQATDQKVPQTPGMDSRQEQYGVSLNISWEVDVWGRLQNQKKAALSNAKARAAEYRAARHSLAAQTAKAWFNAITRGQQLKLAEETLENFQNNLALVENRYVLGLVDSLDVHLLRASVGSAKSNLERQKRIRDLAVRTLEILIGRYPAAAMELSQTLPNLTDQVPAGLPSELLLRRPDLVAMFELFHSAGYTYKEAKDASLPRIMLTASGGTRTDELSKVVTSDALLWNLAGNLTSPLLQRKKIRGNIALQETKVEEALANYKQKILKAFQEVEHALAAESLLTAEVMALHLAKNNSRSAEARALEGYEKGLTDITTLLTTQRRAFDTESQLLEISNQRLINRVDFYLALGGDLDVLPKNQSSSKGAFSNASI